MIKWSCVWISGCSFLAYSILVGSPAKQKLFVAKSNGKKRKEAVICDILGKYLQKGWIGKRPLLWCGLATNQNSHHNSQSITKPWPFFILLSAITLTLEAITLILEGKGTNIQSYIWWFWFGHRVHYLNLILNPQQTHSQFSNGWFANFSQQLLKITLVC